MSRRGRLLLPLLATLALGLGDAGGQQPAAASSGITLSIVGTNDRHGAIVPRDGRGGLAMFAGFVQNLRAARARDGGAVLVIDAGDMFQGTLESNLNEGAAIVDAYNAIGYAAATIGNHEFDFGPVGPRATPRTAADDPRGALKARAAQSRFPFVAANLVDSRTGAPVRWPNVQPSVLVKAAGVSVGIIGGTTTRTLKATISGNTIGLAIAPLDAAVATQAKQLRARGAAVVILTVHAGGRCTQFGNPTDLTSCEQPSEIGDLIAKLPRGTLDAVVAGHTHQGDGTRDRWRADHRVVLVGRRIRANRSHDRARPLAGRRSQDFSATRRLRLRGRRRGAVSIRPCHRRRRCQVRREEVTPDPNVERMLAAAIDNAKQAKQQPLGVATSARSRAGIRPRVAARQPVRRPDAGGHAQEPTWR